MKELQLGSKVQSNNNIYEIVKLEVDDSKLVVTAKKEHDEPIKIGFQG